jgi:hypothetical protein
LGKIDGLKSRVTLKKEIEKIITEQTDQLKSVIPF